MRDLRRLFAIAILVVSLVGAGPVGVIGPVEATNTASECSFPVTETDATGTAVTIEEEPTEIITLGPSATQTMWEIGAKEKVIAVSSRSTYLEGTDDPPTIETYPGVDTEKVIDLQPDLVLAANIIEDDSISKLREAGITVYQFRWAVSLSDVEEKTRLYGPLTGTCAGADTRAREMEENVSLVTDAVSDESGPRVLYYMGGGWTAGSSTYINDIIVTAGGSNIAVDAGISGYREISDETVVDLDPEYIVYPSSVSGIEESPAYNSTTAVKEGNVIEVSANYMNQPAPRSIQVLRTLAEAFHPGEIASLGETVFQSETVVFGDGLSGHDTLTSTSGGGLLGEYVSKDQSPGLYTTDGQSDSPGLFVRTPRIYDYEFQSQSTGFDLAGKSVERKSARINVTARWNFHSSEDLIVEVQDENGVELTDEVLTSGSTDTLPQSGIGSSYVNLDLSDEEAGTYTIRLQGEDKLDWGDASVSETINVTSDRNLGVAFDTDRAARGEHVGFTVSGGSHGQTAVVAIDEDDFRTVGNDSKNASVFRKVQDTTTDVGYVSDSTGRNVSYAVMEFDGMSAHGEIETQHLDTTDVSIAVYPIDATPRQVAAGTDFGTIDTTEAADEDELVVHEGHVFLFVEDISPYVIGSEVTLRGNASGVDHVDVYVRDNQAWQRVAENVTVDADGTFESDGLVLSKADAGNTLQLPGTYRIGVIDSTDAAGQEMNLSAFRSGLSQSNAIRAVKGGLSAEFHTVNSQVNVDRDNSLDVTGFAPGQSNVTFVMIDEGGHAGAETIDVDAAENTFTETDFALDGPFENLTKGSVTVQVISRGRDGEYGDGDFGSATSLSDFVNNELGNAAESGKQVRDRITAETVEDTASDDMISNATFRYVDSTTEIESVSVEGNESARGNPVPLGTTAVVTGQTNLRPKESAITVELIGDEGHSRELVSTTSWEADGQWQATFDTDGLQPGTYTITSDDGTNSDRVEVELLSEQHSETTTKASGIPSESTAPATPSVTDTSTTTPTATKTRTSTARTTEAPTPGFGIGVSLIALLGAALLARWRE